MLTNFQTYERNAPLARLNIPTTIQPNNVHALVRNMQYGVHHTPVLNVVNNEKYVLYIDDDQDDRETFSYALEQCNAKINLITAVDADDALEKLASHPKPSCIYLDINMPKIMEYNC